MKKHLIAAALILAALTSPAKSQSLMDTALAAVSVEPVAPVVAPVAKVAAPFIGLGETTHRIKSTVGVVDALMTDGGSYWISMYNKGGSYMGYAQYACSEMPQGIRTTITIWDAAEMYAHDNLVPLAKFYCNKK